MPLNAYTVINIKPIHGGRSSRYTVHFFDWEAHQLSPDTFVILSPFFPPHSFVFVWCVSFLFCFRSCWQVSGTFFLRHSFVLCDATFYPFLLVVPYMHNPGLLFHVVFFAVFILLALFFPPFVFFCFSSQQRVDAVFYLFIYLFFVLCPNCCSH